LDTQASLLRTLRCFPTPRRAADRSSERQAQQAVRKPVSGRTAAANWNVEVGGATARPTGRARGTGGSGWTVCGPAAAGPETSSGAVRGVIRRV